MLMILNILDIQSTFDIVFNFYNANNEQDKCKLLKYNTRRYAQRWCDTVGKIRGDRER